MSCMCTVHMRACMLHVCTGTSASASTQFTNSVCSFRVSLSHLGNILTSNSHVYSLHPTLVPTKNAGHLRDKSETESTHKINFFYLNNVVAKETRHIADIARMVSWPKLWDLALAGGPKYVNALRVFVRIIAHSSTACPTCDVNSLNLINTLSTPIQFQIQLLTCF